MSRILALYRNAFGGLSEPAWMLAVVMLINRSGNMVIPFLSVYLTDSLHFSVKQVGLLLSLFGLGSMGGSFLGGWLTDRIGHFRVQFYSLMLGGCLFFGLLWLQSFATFAVGIFILSLVSECLRPANSSSVSFYAQPENITRAFSLNRMAANLGFSVGPMLAGLLATISYRWLFVADGITCLFAGLFFFFYFRHRQGFKPEVYTAEKTTFITNNSPYKDLKYILFVFLSLCFATIFFQFFSTLPLYYRQVHHLSEAQIGLLLALNGAVVFSLEMIVVYVASQRFKAANLIMTGTLLVGFSFVLLNAVTDSWILYLAMIILSVAEILALPFMAAIPVQRSTNHNRGTYMGMYNIAFSTAFILGPFLGTTIISQYNYEMLWWASGFMAIITAGGFYWLISEM